MIDRRESARDKVIYGGVAAIDDQATRTDCVVRNISDKGASLEFSNVIQLPKERMLLTIARKGRSFLAKVIWLRDNFAGVAFTDESMLKEHPSSDIEERLRISEKKKRQLQRRINDLLSNGR
jgi:PilZ domain